MKDFILTPDWPAPANVVCMTTLRHPNASFLPELPGVPKWLKQVHGNVVASVDAENSFPEADAAVAFNPATICAVKTADCLPVLICDTKGTQVAAIHAGWRGLASGVIAATCKKLSAKPAECLAWLGPAIGPEAFEVSHDVLDNFLAHGWDPKQVAAAFIPKPNTPDKWLGNLPLLARFALQQQGFLADNIYGGEWCTYSDPVRFYSYRRSKESGRLVSLIWFK